MNKKHSLLTYTIGWTGTAVLMTAYALNSFGVIPSTGFWYPFANLVAAIFLGIRVFADRNYSNLILEIVFGAVALVSLVMLVV
jgi:hypothetical protein